MNSSIKLLFCLSLIVMLAACSSNDKTEIDAVAKEDMSASPMDDGQSYDAQSLQGYQTSAQPGTQQDLVTTVGDRVFYGYDRYDLSEEARQTLAMQARWMQTYPSVDIIIEGHADERGTREYNLALGDRRAQSAKDYLVALGVASTRIRTISYGKERPVALGSNPAAWAQNRRGVTIVE